MREEEADKRRKEGKKERKDNGVVNICIEVTSVDRSERSKKSDDYHHRVETPTEHSHLDLYMCKRGRKGERK